MNVGQFMNRSSASGAILMLILVGLGMVILIDPHPPRWIHTPVVRDMVHMLWCNTGAAISIGGGLLIGMLSIRPTG